jgi:hypothetical protein
MPRRTLSLTLTMCWIAIVCSGATDPFVGKWKLNASKSQLADQMTIQVAGSNRYTLTFSGSGETRSAADGTGSTRNLRDYRVHHRRGGRYLEDRP